MLNPLLLLEQGQQVGNVPLSHLFYVMGLDVLFMAGESNCFVERVGGLLGEDTLIFPVDSLDRQPNLTVGQVIDDVYKLRNILAHGREIPMTPYREPWPLQSANGGLINSEVRLYIEVLHEASLFILTAALRKIFLEGHGEQIADTKQWRKQLKQFTLQCKEDVGGTKKKHQGR